MTAAASPSKILAFAQGCRTRLHRHGRPCAIDPAMAINAVSSEIRPGRTHGATVIPVPWETAVVTAPPHIGFISTLALPAGETIPCLQLK